MGLKVKAEDVEAKYDVTLNYPNLELHSAAASGNVGLVHYALTHGQPVNSVLHGVLPIHAACSGGSVSVVKMLIERGADVNAPRLPRRYSDGKKSNVPSIGAAGSTPLHFAAANGHAGVVQILLTCGAIPYKSDKNGMTPETLAEINGHTDVIRVLRVWEHLKATDPTMSVADGSSYQASEVDEDESRHGSFSSRKGKERAFSFASNVSDSTTGQAVKLKQSLEGMFSRGRTSRSGSIVSTRPEIPSPLTGLDRFSGSAIQDEASPIEPSSSPGAAIPDANGPNEDTGGETLDRVTSAASGSSQPPPLVRITSENSDETEAPPASPCKTNVDHLGPAPSRHNPSTTGSSRRPSLPSIFEKAAHPGAAFRAALRWEHKDHHAATQQAISPTTSTFEDSSSPTSAPTSADSSHGHGFFRGRRDSSKSRHGHNKYMSKHALLHLFKRSHSPPSRSPSPPRRDGTVKPIDSEQIEEGIEKMRRASLDLDLRQSTSRGSDDAVAPRMPLSAPHTKTTFFVDSIIPPPIPPIDPASIPLPPTPTPRAPSSPNVRRTRSRQSSDVIAPSPLANEWATSSDSDTPRSIGIRRAKTEVIKTATLSQPGLPRVALQDHRTNPPSPLRIPTTRSRAVTSPSTPVGSVTRSASGTKLAGMGWADPIDLRKVAALRQESLHRLPRRYTNSDLEAFRKSSERKTEYDDAGEADAEVEDEGESTPQASPSYVTSAKAEDVEGDDAEDTQSETRATAERPGNNGRPSLSVAITEPSYVDLADPPGPKPQGRYRGASIGSMSATTESSRVSTPPGSSLRMSLLNSDEESRSPTYLSYTYDAKSMMPPPPPPSSTGSAGRARGKSVSSTSSIPSDMSLSYFNASTPGTSLTPQSTLSMSRFPPVPEHAVAHHPANRRKVSNRAEAREAKQQAEDDVLQLAQMPVSLDSSRSLAAQLAAYGESVAVEKKFAKREKMDGSEMSYSGSAMSASGKSARSGRSGHSALSASETEAESWFSANSGGGSSGEGTTSTRARSRRKVVQPMAEIPPQLLPPANAPKSSLSSIDQIYDKRAAAYRDRMAALTAIPPSFPSSLSSAHRIPRPRTASNESWLTGGASSRQPGWLTPAGESTALNQQYGGGAPSFITAAGSLVTPTHAHSHRSEKAGALGSVRSVSGVSAKAGSISLGTGSQSLQGPVPRPGSTATRLKSTAPAPIADVISTRYAGMSPPPNVPQPPRLDPSSPYVSIFSHRYSGQPHDGDDSDDDAQTSTALTVVENDWRATRGLPADEGFERKGRWGQFKGAIGKVGHRKA